MSKSQNISEIRHLHIFGASRVYNYFALLSYKVWHRWVLQQQQYKMDVYVRLVLWSVWTCAVPMYMLYFKSEDITSLLVIYNLISGAKLCRFTPLNDECTFTYRCWTSYLLCVYRRIFWMKFVKCCLFSNSVTFRKSCMKVSRLRLKGTSLTDINEENYFFSLNLSQINQTF